MNSQPAARLFRGLFETHLQVTKLDESMRFYGDILGLELGFQDRERGVALYWIGAEHGTMVGIWERPPWAASGSTVTPQHLAFEVRLEDMQTTIARLKERGIAMKNFFDQITDELSVFGWIPAASIYFHDLDGHLLELIARLEGEPAAGIGVVSYAKWESLRGG